MVSIASPFDLEKCSNSIAKWHKALYHYNLLNNFKRNYLRNKEQLLLNSSLDFGNIDIICLDNRGFNRKNWKCKKYSWMGRAFYNKNS